MKNLKTKKDEAIENAKQVLAVVGLATLMLVAGLIVSVKSLFGKREKKC